MSIYNSAQAALAELHRDARPVTAVYSGKLDACACGCTGKHSSAKGAITRIRSIIVNAIREGDAVQITVEPNVFVAVDTKTRLYVAYIERRIA